MGGCGGGREQQPDHGCREQQLDYGLAPVRGRPPKRRLTGVAPPVDVGLARREKYGGSGRQNEFRPRQVWTAG